MDREMIEYYPEWLREYREIKILADVHQEQADTLFDSIEKIWNNNFVETLDEDGCSRWESMLKIKNKDTYTIEDRRSKIAGNLLEKRPYTFRSLCNMLDALTGGAENYTIELNKSNYTLEVRVALTSKNMKTDADKLVRRVVPANLATTVDLLYNVYNFLTKYTHNQLSDYTHHQLREEILG